MPLAWRPRISRLTAVGTCWWMARIRGSRSARARSRSSSPMRSASGDLPALDRFYVPVGNGALIAGIGTWLRSAAAATRVIGVQAAGAPAMTLSWRERRPIETPRADTIADGIAARVPVPEALELMIAGRRRDAAGRRGSDRGRRRSEMSRALPSTIEPAAGAAWAAVRAAGSPAGPIGVLVTGGNVSPRGSPDGRKTARRGARGCVDVGRTSRVGREDAFWTSDWIARPNPRKSELPITSRPYPAASWPMSLPAAAPPKTISTPAPRLPDIRTQSDECFMSAGYGRLGLRLYPPTGGEFASIGPITRLPQRDVM